MSFADDEDILQDFLVEAGEILEQLSEQLVELENKPDDKDLLNAIFRGFHTVKGGAGFLQLTPMVDCCHVTENLFDILRNGKREVTSSLMDVVLQALDTVNEQFTAITQREEPQPADPELIATLGRLVKCEDLEPGADASTAAPAPAEPAVSAESEFEEMLDSAVEPKPQAAEPQVDAVSNSASDSDEITEDEFEALLDQLHGKGQGPKASQASESASTPASPNEASSAVSANVDKPSSGDPDIITDDEFENLLDELHGKGKGPTDNVPTDKPSLAAVPNPPPADKPSEPKPIPIPTKAAPKTAAAKPKDAPVAEVTVRVDTQRLDDIMNMVGELVLVRNRLVRLGNSSSDEALGKAVANLDVVTADLQTSVMKTRMQPIKKVFGRFPRVVRDLARSLKKEIGLELVGEDTDLDKNLVEALADPLVHLVRNSVDHGIESPDEREKNGKSRAGKVILAAEQEGDHILLSITDDGAGMDADKLRSIAVNKGLMDDDAAQRLSDNEAFNLIFAPGFSTKTEISDVSGRGVGMDVVKTKITQLNGSIQIKSTMGKGTRITIKVPLTLAIMPTLMIMLDQQTFALPLVSVNEIFHMDLTQSNIVDGQECVTIRDKAVPLFHLKRWLINSKEPYANPEEAHVVIVSVGTRRVGFVVDQLIGQEEVVIKPLGKMLNGTPGMAGATITGDGTIALILDVPSMLKEYVGNVA